MNNYKTFPKHYDSAELERLGKQSLALRRVSQAVRNGTIKPDDHCALCTYVGKTVAHHYRGYDYPFDVWWICRICNANLDVHDGSLNIQQARAYLFEKRYVWQNYWKNKSRELMDCVCCGLDDQRRKMEPLNWDEYICQSCASKLLD